MENSPAVNELLKTKYDLHKAPEVTIAAQRYQARTGERIPQAPRDRIQNYLNRFHEILDREDPDKREHGIDAIKRLLYRNYVIKPDNIPESFWEAQRRIIRERGQSADLENVDWDELKRQTTEALIVDQKASLDKWVDYLSSPDAPYSDSLKYWALRSVLNMGEYDKGKKIYPQRSKGTTKLFPDLNREALAYVLDAVDKKYKGQEIDLSALKQQERTHLEKLLQGESFGKLYAWAIQKVTPDDTAGLANTQGKWVKYDRGSDPMSLVASLQGHGTGWCTAGESTAQAQLQGGDFYVYFSHDSQANPSIPRVAIRMEGSNIAEVRGIAPEQNLDGFIAPIVEKKLEEFPDGIAYQKKVADMKRLTEIDHKRQRGEQLEASDLFFLYEIDSQIQGFGHSRDPRIEDIRDQRNLDEDMSIIFRCTKAQIAHYPEELRTDTKAYVGPLVPGIFDRLAQQQIEHIYTSFPEGKISIQHIEIGGKTKERLQLELIQAGNHVHPRAGNMIQGSDFTILPTTQTLDTVRLKVGDFGLADARPTTDQLYKRALELGLELCPPEVGPHYRLQYKDQPFGEHFCIGMKPIISSHSSPNVFDLGHDGEGLWLQASWAIPGRFWDPRDVFVVDPKNWTHS